MTEYTEKIPEYGDVFTVEEFLQMVDMDCLIDYDGSGNPAKNGKMSKEYVYPSRARELLPEDATHVVWYNK